MTTATICDRDWRSHQLAHWVKKQISILFRTRRGEVPCLSRQCYPSRKKLQCRKFRQKELHSKLFQREVMVESLLCRQTISAKAPPEVPVAIPIGERKWRHVPCVDHTSTESFEFHREWVRVSRHSPKLLGLDGACFWKKFDASSLQRIRTNHPLNL